MVVKLKKGERGNELDVNLFHHRYNSYTRFINDAINSKDTGYYKKLGYSKRMSDTDSRTWRGGTNEEAEELALKGWQTGIKEVAPEYTTFKNFGNTPRPSFAGSKINIPAIIGNDPRVYYKLKNKVSAMERLVVWIPLGYSGGNSSDKVLNYGKKALEYIADLNKTFDVSVNAYYLVHVEEHKSYYAYSCKLKEFGQNMVINNFAYALHPSFTRVMGFRMQETGIYGDGYGRCQFENSTNRKFIKSISQERCKHIMLPILNRYDEDVSIGAQIIGVAD